MYDPIEVRLANYHIKTPGGCWRWMKHRANDLRAAPAPSPTTPPETPAPSRGEADG